MNFSKESAKWLHGFLIRHRYALLRPYILKRLFLLNDEVRLNDAQHMLGKQDVCGLLKHGFVTGKEGAVSSLIKIIAFNDLFLLAGAKRRKNFVYIGRDSYLLADYLGKTLKRRYGKGLDLGCGSGIQALTIFPFCKSTYAVDINRDALRFAAFNSAMNERSIKVGQSDLFKKLKGEKFDIIVTNPPYVLFPEEAAEVNTDGYGGGNYGMSLPFRILQEAPAHLNDGGEFYMICGSPVVNGKDILLERLKRLRWGEITVKPVRHFIYKDLHRFHTRQGIHHSVLHIVKIKKGKVAFHIKPMPLIRRIYDNVEMALVRAFY